MSGNNFVLQSYNAGGLVTFFLILEAATSASDDEPRIRAGCLRSLRVDTGGVFFAPTALGASAGTNFLCLDANSWNVATPMAARFGRRLKDNIVSLDPESELAEILTFAAGFLCVERQTSRQGSADAALSRRKSRRSSRKLSKPAATD